MLLKEGAAGLLDNPGYTKLLAHHEAYAKPGHHYVPQIATQENGDVTVLRPL